MRILLSIKKLFNNKIRVKIEKLNVKNMIYNQYVCYVKAYPILYEKGKLIKKISMKIETRFQFLTLKEVENEQLKEIIKLILYEQLRKRYGNLKDIEISEFSVVQKVKHKQRHSTSRLIIKSQKIPSCVIETYRSIDQKRVIKFQLSEKALLQFFTILAKYSKIEMMPQKTENKEELKIMLSITPSIWNWLLKWDRKGEEIERKLSEMEISPDIHNELVGLINLWLYSIENI